MTVQNEIDLHEATVPLVLVALQQGPLAPRELDKKIEAPGYIIRRAVWTLVNRGQVQFDSEYRAAVV